MRGIACLRQRNYRFPRRGMACRAQDKILMAKPIYTFIIDLIKTLILWIYFIFGFFLFFSLFYLLAYLFSPNREQSFQRLNCLFYRGFLKLIKIIIPRHHWQIASGITQIKSSVIVCNHVSYLDPLIIISLFEHHKTIVKSKFFHAPVFGWLMKVAGYLPSSTDGKFGYLMIKQMEEMREFLNKGGNLIIFPEGTRKKDGKSNNFNPGAFKIAKLCHAPIKVLQIQNSDKLFTPGSFLFNTGITNLISVKNIADFSPDYSHNPPSASELSYMVQLSFANANKRSL